MMSRQIARFFFTKPTTWAAEKSQLAALRKKTGYTFANCKKALELHNNDLFKAEGWLKEQAQALGWSKATKLEGRQTSQGLVAVLVDNNDAALVEINCETDFVARNDTFKSMAEMAAKACLNFARTQMINTGAIAKMDFDTSRLKDLKASDGKLLEDHMALMIGTMGENAILKRGVSLKAENGVRIYGYAHPSGTDKNSVLLGRVCGVVALKQTEDLQDVDLDQLGKDLCQHVVGMDPKRIGSDDDKPAKNTDEEECLIYQEFINDNSILVKDLLSENGAEVVDFKRFECGELNNSITESLDMLETCQ